MRIATFDTGVTPPRKTKNLKTLQTPGSNQLFAMFSPRRVVEAPGIEPGSENLSRKPLRA